MAAKKTIAELLVELKVKRDEVKKAKDDLEGLEKQGKETGKAIGDSLSKGAEGAKKLGGQGSKTGGLLKKGFSEAKGSLSGLAQGLPAIGKLLTAIPPQAAIAVGAIVLVVAAITKAVKAVISFNREQSELLDRIDKSSQAMGTSAETFQELEFAAGRSGATIEDVADGLKDLDIKLNDLDANAGDPKFLKVINELGISFKELKAASPEKRLEILAEGLQKIEDPTERVTASIRLLGETAGRKLQPLLAGGAEGIKQLREEAQEFGVASNEAVAKGAAFQDSVANYEQTLLSLKAAIFEGISPAFQELVDNVREFIGENKELIQQSLGTVMKAIAVSIKAVVNATVAVVKWFVRAGEAVSGFIDYIKSAVKATVRIVEAFSFIGEAIKTNLIGSFELSFDIFNQYVFDPIKRWITFLTGKVIAGIKAYAKFYKQNIIDPIVEFAKKVKEFFEPALNFIRDKLSAVGDAFDKFGGKLDFLDKWKEKLDEIKSAIIDFIKEVEPLRRLAIKLGVIEEEGGGFTEAAAAVAARAKETLGADEGSVIPEVSEEDQAEAAKRAAKLEAEGKAANEKRKNELLKKARKKTITQPEINELVQLGVPLETINKLLNAKKGGKKKETSGVSLEELLTSVRAGKGSARDLKRLATELSAKTPETKDIKPTVAVTFFNFDAKFNIKSSAPAESIADNITKKIKKEFKKATSKAGDSLHHNVII